MIQEVLAAIRDWANPLFKKISDAIGTPLDGQPANLFAAIAASGGGGGSDPEVKAMLQQIIDAHLIDGINLSGLTFTQGVDARNVIDAISLVNSIYSVNDDTITILSPQTTSPARCVYFTANNLVEARAMNLFRNTYIKEAIVPKLELINETSQCAIFYGASSLLHADLKSIIQFVYPGSIFVGCTRLIDLELGKNFAKSESVNSWSPTEALLANISSLVEDGEPFANNREKLLYNIREHIAGNLKTITQGYSITFSAAVKAAILADAATTEAFTNKGWTIA